MRSLHETRGDGKEIFEKLVAPGLVLHRQGDRAVPLEEGRRLAAFIPGARFQVLNGNDHYFPVDRDSAMEAVDRITRFLPAERDAERNGEGSRRTRTGESRYNSIEGDSQC